MDQWDDDLRFLNLKQGNVCVFEMLFQNKRLRLLKFMVRLAETYPLTTEAL